MKTSANMVVIRLHYGQYKACGIIKYRTRILCGLTRELSKVGYDIEMLPSLYWDRLEIEICGRTVFRCRLSYLEFGCDAKEDLLAMKAINAVQDAIKHLKIKAPDVTTVGNVTAPAGKLTLIQRNMISMIDACSMIEEIEPSSNRVTAIQSLIEPSTVNKRSLKLIQYECITWKDELPASNKDLRSLLESIIESTCVISDHWSIVQPLLQAKCESCSECIPYCRCNISTSSSDSLKSPCSVCGIYCICQKVPSRELFKLCRKCGSKTCICSSSSEGTVAICNVGAKLQKNTKDIGI